MGGCEGPRPFASLSAVPASTIAVRVLAHFAYVAAQVGGRFCWHPEHGNRPVSRAHRPRSEAQTFQLPRAARACRFVRVFLTRYSTVCAGYANMATAEYVHLLAVSSICAFAASRCCGCSFTVCHTAGARHVSRSFEWV